LRQGTRDGGREKEREREIEEEKLAFATLSLLSFE
jgi:hypothetical protein